VARTSKAIAGTHDDIKRECQEKECGNCCNCFSVLAGEIVSHTKNTADPIDALGVIEKELIFFTPFPRASDA